MDERLLQPSDQPDILRPTMNTPVNIRRLNKSDVLVENMQIHEYLTNVPQVGRRDYRVYPPRYADTFYVPPPPGDHRQYGPGMGRGRGRRGLPNVDPDNVHAARR